MTFYYNDAWLAYLAECIIRQNIDLCKSQCLGCRDNMSSAILHLHCQLSLLDKLKLNFEQIRAEVLPTINNLYTNMESKLPHSDDIAKDKIIYCNIGRNFLITCTVESLYYGRYITEANDSFIAETLTKVKKPRAKKK